MSDTIADTSWSVQLSGTDPPYWLVLDARGNVIAAVERDHDNSRVPHMGHANLFAAAPALLAACRAALSVGEAIDRPDDENQRIYLGKRTIAILRDAVARATTGG
jgi:hypothetical protein